MAVAFDALGTAATSTSSANASWTHTSASGGGTVLVFIAVGFSPTATTNGQMGSYSSVTYNGNAMTLLASLEADDGGGNGGGCFLYGITGQSSGGSVTVATNTYSPPAGASVADFIAYSLSFTGGASFGTAVTRPSTADGGAASGSVTVASTSSSSQVFAGFCDGTGGQSITAGTQRFLKNLNSNTGAGNACGATSAGTGGNVTISASWTSDWWAGIGVEVQPPSSVSKSDSDTGTGTDSVGSVTATLSDSDTATGTDSVGTVSATLSSPDSAAGADGAESVTVTAAAEAGSGADGAAPLVILSAPSAVARPPRTWQSRFGPRRPRAVVPVFLPPGAQLVSDGEQSGSADDARVFPQAAILILPAV